MEDWISHLEMEEVEIMLNQNQSQSPFDEFLREILEQPENFSPQQDDEPQPLIQNIGGTSPTNSTLSFDEASFCGNDNITLHKSITSSKSMRSLERSASSYLVCFDNSTTQPIKHEPHSSLHPLGSIKRDLVKDGGEMEQIRKRVRKANQTQDHIIAERKRRQDLTRSIIALSATIPGLKKMDKAYVLGEAVKYIKELQERIKELEDQNNDKRENSVIFIKKSQASCDSNITNCETDNTESLFEVEARVLQKEVLIGIHCLKQMDIVLKIHALLGNLNLSITSCSVLPFGTSTLVINIIAQMDNENSMTMDELVKNLKEYLLKAYGMQQ